jgi:hypothetical protein
LYLKNPCGKANAWLAYEGEKDDLVGMAAAFPRRVSVFGKSLLAWALGDFAIRKSHRSLGPALQLQKACMLPVSNGDVPFCYDFPSNNMAHVYSRMNVKSVYRMVRFAKPIQIDQKVKNIMKENPISNGISWIGNRSLAILDSIKMPKGDHDIEFHQGRFGDEFTFLDNNLKLKDKIRVEKKSEYLNWRYLDNTYKKHEMITMRKNKKLVGCAIFSKNNFESMIVDFIGDPRGISFEILIFKVVELLRKQGVHTVSMEALESFPWISTLNKSGFYPRESSSVVFYTRPGGQYDGVITSMDNWFLTHGDRDS